MQHRQAGRLSSTRPHLLFRRHTENVLPVADIVVEVVSPGDESREKFGFYFEAGVKEILIVDPDARTVEWFTRTDSDFRLAEGSELLGVSAAELAKAIDWPSPD